MTGRRKLRRDAEHLRSFYARVLAGPEQPCRELDAGRIAEAQRRVVSEREDEQQLRLDVSGRSS